MTLADALAHVEAGGKARSEALPIGTVLKTEQLGWSKPAVRVVWEATGSGFDFTPRPEHETADWQPVAKGWGSYVGV